MIDTQIRCPWAMKTPEERNYHDREWGTPVHDDRRLFEFLILESAQAGLSWLTILRKREHYRRAFDGFDPKIVADYDGERIQALVNNPGIVRNRRKVEAAVCNAHAFLAVQREYGSFDKYLWRFVGGEAKRNAWRELKDVPAKTPEADALSKDLRHRGFKFVGPTICYAFMQAVGMVNDHIVDCFRWREFEKPIGLSRNLTAR